LDLILLEASIIAMVLIAWKIDKKSAYLLIPYLIWVAFAGVLNYLSIIK
jgi:tryptophan-rich sensory protein